MYITIHTASLTSQMPCLALVYIYIYTCTTQWLERFESVLSVAAVKGHTDTVQVLLQRGADVNDQDGVCTY